jgi:hypothetical protein
MITLTREEAQQVLDAFESATPKYTRARKDGKTLGGALDYWKLEQHKRMPALAILRARLSAPEPEPVRLRRGDTLRCIETNELCTVWATSTTGKTLVKWKANDFGEYTAEQIGDLFWVEPKPEPEPVAWMYEYGTDHGDAVNQIFWHKNLRLEKPDGMVRNVVPLYTAPPQREWQGLTDEEILGEYRQSYGDDGDLTDVYFARAIEAKLKEKNT